MTTYEMPAFELSDDQRELRRTARAFVAEEIAPLDFGEWEWRDDPRDRVPWHVVDAAHERGLQDLAVPEEFGGVAAPPLSFVVAAEELGAGDVGLAVTLELLWRNTRLIDGLAAADLRERFFEAFVDDPRHLLALALTEPAHGSDYQVDYEGLRFDTTAEKDGDEWVLDGEKCYISCGVEASTYIVYAQTDPDVPAQEGTTAFLVPGDADGLRVTHVWDKIGARLLNNATIELAGVRVPAENVLGEVDAAKRRTGEVLKVGQLNSGAIALGAARRAFEDAFEYATERVQGGTEIIDHQVVGHDFAEMATEIQAARSFLWTAARAVEAQGDAYEPAFGQMAKLFAATRSVDVCQRALEKFGGLGVMIDNDRPVQKYLRDALVYLHGDGTREAHGEVIAGALREQFEG